MIIEYSLLRLSFICVPLFNVPPPTRTTIQPNFQVSNVGGILWRGIEEMCHKTGVASCFEICPPHLFGTNDYYD